MLPPPQGPSSHCMLDAAFPRHERRSALGHWIRKVERSEHVTPLVLWDSENGDSHECEFPSEDELTTIGPRSMWQCSCGRTWRLTAPYWRHISHLERGTGTDSGVDTGLPEWVLDIAGPPKQSED